MSLEFDTTETLPARSEETTYRINKDLTEGQIIEISVSGLTKSYTVPLNKTANLRVILIEK